MQHPIPAMIGSLGLGFRDMTEPCGRAALGPEWTVAVIATLVPPTVEVETKSEEETTEEGGAEEKTDEKTEANKEEPKDKKEEDKESK